MTPEQAEKLVALEEAIQALDAAVAKLKKRSAGKAMIRRLIDGFELLEQRLLRSEYAKQEMRLRALERWAKQMGKTDEEG